MSWNEWKSNFPIYTIFSFWVMVDFVLHIRTWVRAHITYNLLRNTELQVSTNAMLPRKIIYWTVLQVENFTKFFTDKPRSNQSFETRPKVFIFDGISAEE